MTYYKRLTRLESVLGVAEGPAIEDLPKLGSEEFDAALALGWTRFGFQRDRARYLSAPLAALLPEPRSPAAAAMVAAIETEKLPFIVLRFVPTGADGHPVPDGWRPS